MHILRHLFAFALLCIPLAAQEYPIVELHTSGSERYRPEQILAYSGLRVDKSTPVSLKTVEDAARKLVGSGVFLEVGYSHRSVPDGMRVDFNLKDKPADQFQPAVFDNLPWLSDDELKAEITKRVPLFNGSVPLIGGLQDEVAAAIQDVLSTAGVQAHVASITGGAQAGQLAGVHFAVDNVDIKITQVNVTGATDDVLPQIGTAARKIIDTDYTVLKAAAFSRYDLREIFDRNGYLKAIPGVAQPKVVSQAAGKASVLLTYPIEEGRQFRYLGGTFTGNEHVAAAELQKHIKVVPGYIANALELKDNLARVRATYAAKGYMRMTLQSTPIFHDGEGTVEYTWKVNEGDLFSMGKIDVVGMEDKNAEKVRQAWKLREGDPFDANYVMTFPSTIHSDPPMLFVVEETEGERPKSIDVTLVACKQGVPCKQRTDQLYEPDQEQPPK